MCGSHTRRQMTSFLSSVPLLLQRKNKVSKYYISNILRDLSMENTYSRKIKIKGKGKVFLISQCGLIFFLWNTFWHAVKVENFAYLLPSLSFISLLHLTQCMFNFIVLKVNGLKHFNNEIIIITKLYLKYYSISNKWFKVKMHVNMIFQAIK